MTNVTATLVDAPAFRCRQVQSVESNIERRRRKGRGDLPRQFLRRGFTPGQILN